MPHLLQLGQTVYTQSSGLACQVDTFLGGGGQGQVYQAELGGKPVALKWYFPTSATPEQRLGLDTLVKKGSPTAKFLWPMDLALSPEISGFGYIMPLRNPTYKGIIDLMKRRVEPGFRTLVTAGLELAHSYLQLHSMGLCYRDISFGNVFFHPETGDVLICDNDNVAIDGNSWSGVLGTPRFMAPEIVRGEALPSTQSDLFSLAVLLFYIFMVHHPLEGKQELEIKCLDLPAMRKLYGTHPVFIFDPKDHSNEPVVGYHDNALAFWPIYPVFFQRLFIRAFTEGLNDPHQRVRESEWRTMIAKLRDAIFYCPHCGSELFYDAETLKISGGSPPICWACHQESRLPARMRIGGNILMLNHDTHLYPHHIDLNRLYDFSEPQAQVVQHPTNPQIWGLKNLSSSSWQVFTINETPQKVEPGQSVTLAIGIRIDFGNCQGEIRI